MCIGIVPPNDIIITPPTHDMQFSKVMGLRSHLIVLKLTSNQQQTRITDNKNENSYTERNLFDRLNKNPI